MNKQLHLEWGSLYHPSEGSRFYSAFGIVMVQSLLNSLFSKLHCCGKFRLIALVEL